MKILSSLLFAFAVFPIVQAEVITDGSLGAKVELNGKDFQITPELGQQFGGNLFHSFQSFNLNADESATFSGANTVQNIISRVTGGSPSLIDGTLRSTIPNADLYFINPYGVMFGQNAKLDLQGGFHVSTADYLKLQDGGRFDARNPSNSLLSVAPVSAFGFLTDSPAPIAAQNSRLAVLPAKSLSIIGGNLQFQGALPILFDEKNIYTTFASSAIKTTGGQLNLASVGSTGEVLLNNNQLTLTGRGGDISLYQTLVDSSGLGSGNLLVRGNRLMMQNSTFQANTLGEFNGGVMDIQLGEALLANSEPYYFGTFLSKTFGAGHGGSIQIKVPELTLKRTQLRSSTLSDANAGNIDLDVARLSLLEGAGVTGNAVMGRGKGGKITVRAADSMLIAGHAVGVHVFEGMVLTDFPSLLDSTSFSTAADSLGGGDIHVTAKRIDLVSGMLSNSSLAKGNSGSLFIQADNVNITEGGFISTATFDTGKAGSIRLDVKETLLISGRRDGTFVTPGVNTRFENPQSSINSFAMQGSGGQIDVTAKTIHVTQDASITASSLGIGDQISSIDLRTDTLLLTQGGTISNSNGIFMTTADAYAGIGFFSQEGIGGDIRIQTNQLIIDNQNSKLQETGIYSDTINPKSGGNLFIQTDSLDMARGAAISARSYTSIGNAGQINIQAQHIHLQERSIIETSAVQGGGGNIVINGLAESLHLDNSTISTSVAAGVGSGGNITLDSPRFMILNHGQIKAQADAGRGGNINIAAQHFVPSFDSLVSASSNLGIDGKITIASPTEDVGNQVLNLSASFLNASSLFPRSCTARVADQRPSQFMRPFALTVKSKAVIAAPEDVRASHSLSTKFGKLSSK